MSDLQRDAVHTQPAGSPERPRFQPPKKKRKWPRRLIILLILAAVLIAAFLLLRRRAVSTVSSDYLPAQADYRDLTVTVTGTGTVKPIRTANVTLALRGDILEAPFGEGDVVRKGQVLYRLDPADGESALRGAQRGVDRAQLALDQAQLNYDTLSDSRATDAQLEAADLNIRSAQLALEDAQDALQRAQDALADYTVTAPITGTVIEKKLDAGDAADPAAGPAVILYDLSQLTFTMNISELDVAQLLPGQSVTFTSDALEGKTFSGTLSKISLNGVTMNGATSYPVTVDIADPDGLYPGMNVSATVLVEEMGTVLTVPVDAVQRGSLVYVAGPGALNENGDLVDSSKLLEREIVLGRNDSENIEVLSGLAAGETVYIPSGATDLFTAMMTMGGRR